jgi:hypothetical protein
MGHSTADAGEDVTEAGADAPITAGEFGAGTSYSPVYLCASGGTCTGTSVTGGGPMPAISGAPDADSCTTAVAGANVCTCLDALTSVSTSTPLVIHSGTYSWAGTSTSCYLTVNRPLIGVDTGSGLPILHRTDNEGETVEGSVLTVPAGSKCNWITGLQLILPNPCYGQPIHCSGAEYSVVITLGSVEGLTIANNLIQGGADGLSDAWVSHAEVGSTSTPGARNVLITGNTFQQQHRTNMNSCVKSNGWAIVNNVFDYTDGYVSPVDLEPFADTWGNDVVTNHEYSYNKFNDPTAAYNGDGAACSGTGNCYVEGMISTGGTDGNGGSHVWASHNYGSWDATMKLLYNTDFTNVVDAGNNLRGNTVPQ